MPEHDAARGRLCRLRDGPRLQISSVKAPVRSDADTHQLAGQQAGADIPGFCSHRMRSPGTPRGRCPARGAATRPARWSCSRGTRATSASSSRSPVRRSELLDDQCPHRAQGCELGGGAPVVQSGANGNTVLWTIAKKPEAPFLPWPARPRPGCHRVIDQSGQCLNLKGDNQQGGNPIITWDMFPVDTNSSVWRLERSQYRQRSRRSSGSRSRCRRPGRPRPPDQDRSSGPLCRPETG